MTKSYKVPEKFTLIFQAKTPSRRWASRCCTMPKRHPPTASPSNPVQNMVLISSKSGPRRNGHRWGHKTLLLFHNPEYFFYLLDQVTEWVDAKNSNVSYWIGLADRHDEGNFVWESGRQLSPQIAEKWGPGQPNNKDGGQDCAYTRDNIDMNDGSCTVKRVFVCQKRPCVIEKDTAYSSGPDVNNGWDDPRQYDAESCRAFCKLNHPTTAKYFAWKSPSLSEIKQHYECWCKSSNAGRTTGQGKVAGSVMCAGEFCAINVHFGS